MGRSDDRIARARKIVEGCLRCVLPQGTALPEEDEDWIESGLLYSMDVVEVQSCIEKAANTPDLFAQAGDAPITTTRSATEAVLKVISQRTQAGQDATRVRVSRDKGEAALTGWGMALGSEVVPIASVEQEFGLAEGTLKERAGIETVSRASDDQSEVTLANVAAREAMRAAGVSTQGLQWIIATSETFLGLPSFAASLHTSLLAPSTCQVLDVGGACVGLLNCLAVADALFAGGRAECVLIASADVHSRILAPGKVPGEFGGLFGDGASAFVLRRSDDGAGTVPYSILTSAGSCAGTFSSALRIRPMADGSISLIFEGEALARAAVDRMERIISDLEITSGRNRQEASAFAVHQPNPRLVDILVRQANLPPGRVPVVARTRGNLGSSTCGVALSMALEEHGAKPRDERGPIFLAAVGPGMLWAGAVLE
jgi:3-oxoacyl-[acyl-carrier-protein] synthase-3